jgi:hypothetical protein
MPGIGHGIIFPSSLRPRHSSVTGSVVLSPDPKGVHMPERQPSRLRSIDEPPCPKCQSGMLERANLTPGLRAISPNIFHCNICDHIEIATKTEGKSHGEIHPPGKPDPAPEAPRGSARRDHPDSFSRSAVVLLRRSSEIAWTERNSRPRRGERGIRTLMLKTTDRYGFFLASLHLFDQFLSDNERPLCANSGRSRVLSWKNQTTQ